MVPRFLKLGNNESITHNFHLGTLLLSSKGPLISILHWLDPITTLRRDWFIANSTMLDECIEDNMKTFLTWFIRLRIPLSYRLLLLFYTGKVKMCKTSSQTAGTRIGFFTKLRKAKNLPLCKINRKHGVQSSNFQNLEYCCSSSILTR
jgi:hypothetical protein